MPKFITIGYGDRAGYDSTPKEIRDAAHAHEAEMKKRGALIGVAGAPAQVRNPLAAGVKTENSAYLSSALPVAGFAVIEAADSPRRSRSSRRRPAQSPMGSWKSGLWCSPNSERTAY